MLKTKQYEVVGIFNSIDEMDQAVDELFLHGFDQSTLSVLANEPFNKAYKKVDELVNNDNTPRSAFYAEENFAIAKGAAIGGFSCIGGMIAVILVNIKGWPISHALLILGMAIILGILLAEIIGHHHKDYIDDQLKKGGLLLWIHLRDKLLKDKAMWVLRNNHARNVHLRYIHNNSKQ